MRVQRLKSNGAGQDMRRISETGATTTISYAEMPINCRNAQAHADSGSHLKAKLVSLSGFVGAMKQCESN